MKNKMVVIGLVALSLILMILAGLAAYIYSTKSNHSQVNESPGVVSAITVSTEMVTNPPPQGMSVAQIAEESIQKFSLKNPFWKDLSVYVYPEVDEAHIVSEDDAYCGAMVGEERHDGIYWLVVVDGERILDIKEYESNTVGLARDGIDIFNVSAEEYLLAGTVYGTCNNDEVSLYGINKDGKLELIRQFSHIPSLVDGKYFETYSYDNMLGFYSYERLSYKDAVFVLINHWIGPSRDSSVEGEARYPIFRFVENPKYYVYDSAPERSELFMSTLDFVRMAREFMAFMCLNDKCYDPYDKFIFDMKFTKTGEPMKDGNDEVVVNLGEEFEGRKIFFKLKRDNDGLIKIAGWRI